MFFSFEHHSYSFRNIYIDILKHSSIHPSIRPVCASCFWGFGGCLLVISQDASLHPYFLSYPFSPPTSGISSLLSSAVMGVCPSPRLLFVFFVLINNSATDRGFYGRLQLLDESVIVWNPRLESSCWLSWT